MVYFSVIFLALFSLAIGQWPLNTRGRVKYDKILEKNIRENAKRGGNVHGHIVAVNDAFRLSDNKRASSNGDIAVTEVIEADNEAALVNDCLFEGDIILDDKESNDSCQSDPSKRNIVKDETKLWPDKTVYYSVASELASIRSLLLSAITVFHDNTCLNFREVDSTYNGDHIQFIKGSGCWSSLGRRGGRQRLSLGQGCEYKGVILHEIMHSVGIWHEQSRPDRDEHVEIKWGNILEGKRKNFGTYSHDKLDDLNLPYDTSSVMHFDWYMFSVEPGKKKTIIARDQPFVELGGKLRGSLTNNDIKEINSLYNC